MQHKIFDAPKSYAAGASPRRAPIYDAPRLARAVREDDVESMEASLKEALAHLSYGRAVDAANALSARIAPEARASAGRGSVAVAAAAPPPPPPGLTACYPPALSALTQQFAAGCASRFATYTEDFALGERVLQQQDRRKPLSISERKAILAATQRLLPEDISSDDALIYLGGVICIRVLYGAHADEVLQCAEQLLAAVDLQNAGLDTLAALASGPVVGNWREPLRAMGKLRDFLDEMGMVGLCLPDIYRRLTHKPKPLEDAALIIAMARRLITDLKVLPVPAREAVLIICAAQHGPVAQGWITFLLVPTLQWVVEQGDMEAMTAERFAVQLGAVSKLASLPKALHLPILKLVSTLKDEFFTADDIMAMFSQLACQNPDVLPVALVLPDLLAGGPYTAAGWARALRLACIAATVAPKICEDRA